MVKAYIVLASIAVVLIFAVTSAFTLNFETIEIYPVGSDSDTYTAPIETQQVAVTPLI